MSRGFRESACTDGSGCAVHGDGIHRRHTDEVAQRRIWPACINGKLLSFYESSERQQPVSDFRGLTPVGDVHDRTVGGAAELGRHEATGDEGGDPRAALPPARTDEYYAEKLVARPNLQVGRNAARRTGSSSNHEAGLSAAAAIQKVRRASCQQLLSHGCCRARFLRCPN